MLVTDFDYELPKELIAQHPMEPRDHSRLLVVNKDSGAIEHKHFYDLIEYLHPGDVLVFNDTRVIPARLHGFSHDGGSLLDIYQVRPRIIVLQNLASGDFFVIHHHTTSTPGAQA